MTAIFVILAVVGLVSAAALLRWGGLIGGCLAVLVAGCCFGHPFFHISLGPLPLTIDRLLLSALLVVYLVYRRLGLAAPKPLGKADVVLGGFSIVLIVSTLAHDWRIDNARPLGLLVFFYLVPVALYWVARQSRLTERAVRWTFAFFAAFGLYLAVTSIAETRQVWWLVYPRYIASAEYEEFFGRARGPFLNPVACGLFLTTGLLGLLMAWPDSGRKARLMVMTGAGLFCVGLYCTLTRSVWLGAALGLTVVVGLSARRSWHVPLLSAATLVGGIVLLTQWDSLAAFKRDRHVSEHQMAQSAKLRPVLAAVAWQMFLDRPVFGCGFGQYKQHDSYYLNNPASDLPVQEARPYDQHNVLLALLTQTGLLGSGLYLLLLLIWARHAWLLWRCGAAPLEVRQFGLLFMSLLAAYLVNAMFHDTAIIVMVNTLVFFMAGVNEGLFWQLQHGCQSTPQRRAAGTCFQESSP